MRQCWTCNTKHDLDDPCRQSPKARTEAAAGGSSLFNGGSKLGPVFTATHDSDDACCGDGITEGESIQADGEGGWVHAWCVKK